MNQLKMHFNLINLKKCKNYTISLKNTIDYTNKSFYFNKNYYNIYITSQINQLLIKSLKHIKY